MTFVEKSIWAQGISIAGCVTAYLAVVWSRMQGVPIESVVYAVPLVATIAVSVVLSVVLAVAAAIFTGDRGTQDERDTHITLRGERIGNVTFSVLALGPMALAMAEVAHFWIANAMLVAYFIGAMTGCAVKLITYRRGF